LLEKREVQFIISLLLFYLKEHILIGIYLVIESIAKKYLY